MNGFQALLTFLNIIATVNTVPSENYGYGSGNVYHGRYTRDVHNPEFLIPRRVLEDGSFNTYSLPNFYDRQEVSERRKRSIEGGEEDLEADKLHLVLPFKGIDHHVELTPYHDFISPDMVIETRGAGLRTNLNEALRFKRASDKQCHYRGIIRDHDLSRAALSLCDGVVGYVQTNHGRYFIEPASEAEPQRDGQHVHIVYERNSPYETKGNRDDAPKKHCGTSDNWEAAWAEQLALRQKRLMEENPEEAKRDAPANFFTHSIHRFIEIGLVADRRFLDFYNNSNYEQYLLTIMNMVSDFYHDRTVGNQIEIDLLISPAAEETLASFAKWAEKMNPKDHNHPNHYDIAVLVTRYDICSEGTNCDLMGLAYVGTACSAPKAACINEDSGLLLGIVIAHEVGHVMGCSHDEEEISGCPSKDKDGSYFIMSPIVFIYTIRWSTCSRKFITTLLESGLGECLNDDPRNPSQRFKYPNMLPGAMYDGDFQCQMSFPKSELCLMSKYQVCEKLWCQTNSSCYSNGQPMADGTKCGENKWCIHKQCVEVGSRPSAIHGHWGRWGPQSTCSRTCGGGISSADRECDNPPPSNGGRYCVGERKKLFVCNTTPCDVKKPSFRAVQCSAFDNQKVLADGLLHKWIPFTSPTVNPCALNCINEKHVFVKLSPMVNDSTPCKPGTNDMCIAGICRKVGCDWKLDSNAIEDKCGICKGDGTKCKPIKGLYTDPTYKGRYTKVVTIPKGARSIHVIEEKADRNVVAVRLEKSEIYCLNGNLSEQRDGDYECAKALILYQHPEPRREEISIRGPIAEDIRIEYAYYVPKSNPGIRYEYYVMSTDPSYKPNYVWDFLDWTECSVKCGGGTMISQPSCIEENGGKVSPTFCEGIPAPDPKSRVCNSELCPARWRVSQWSKCSACNGKKGTKHRKVQCVRPAARPSEEDVQANLDACKGRVPKQTEECVGKRPCRKTCPKKTRNANGVLESKEEKNQPLPLEEQAKMIDKFVDLSMARYLERAYGVSRDENEALAPEAGSQDLQRLLREWSVVEEEKKKRGVCYNVNANPNTKNFTTPKPGSIIKDSVPVSNLVLMEAPIIDQNLQMNLSDRAYQEGGDKIGVGIDISRTKIYNGTDALKMIEKLEGHEPKPSPAQTDTSSTSNNYTT